MSLAYQGAGSKELAGEKGDSPDERRKQIFWLYVEQMFQRRGATSIVFPKERVKKRKSHEESQKHIIGWLSWLAGKMREHSQSEFFVEGLQPSWLSTGAQRAAYGTVVALSLGIVFALIYGLSYGSLGVLSLGLSIIAGIGLGCWSELPLKNATLTASIATGCFIGGLFVETGSEHDADWPLAVLIALIVGVIVGLGGGLGLGSLNHISLVETMS